MEKGGGLSLWVEAEVCLHNLARASGSDELMARSMRSSQQESETTGHLQPQGRLDPGTWPPAKLATGSEGLYEVRGWLCREGKGVCPLCPTSLFPFLPVVDGDLALQTWPPSLPPSPAH